MEQRIQDFKDDMIKAKEEVAENIIKQCVELGINYTRYTIIKSNLYKEHNM